MAGESGKRRTLVIDVPGLSARLLDSLGDADAPGWVDELKRAGRSVIKPVVPGVTMTGQATLSTGVDAAGHGMIANGLAAFHNPELRENLDLSNFESYRCNVSFWEQSNKLLTAERFWKKDGRTAAMLFVQSSMGGAADVVVTPKPEHTPDGKTVSLCWSNPGDLYARLQAELGPFPLHHYWGPMAGMPSSAWIASAARMVWEWEPTDVMWVYIPQMDYDLQRKGPLDESNAAVLGETLSLLTPLVEKAASDGARVVLLSEYGMTPVSRAVAPNVVLRGAGLLETAGGEVDYEKSKAFAMCDHQIAHIYCKDAATVAAVRETFDGMAGVGAVYGGVERAEVGLDCDRAGEVVVISDEDVWFEYRWWEDFDEAPEWVWGVDIHRKPGYDPLEMWANRETRRILADEPGHVKGSHGARPVDARDWPVLLGVEGVGEVVDATEVAGLL